jgi:hypothetical protein
MTDATNFYKQLVLQVGAFVNAYEDLKLMANRISSDSALSGQASTAAQITTRKDLSAADFDNFNAAIGVIEALLNASNPAVNTGGSVRLAFYKLL